MNKPGHAKRTGAAVGLQAPMRRALIASRFADRGFTPSIVDRLINAGVEYPEKLLLMSEQDVEQLPGIGPSRLESIKRYVLMMREMVS